LIKLTRRCKSALYLLRPVRREVSKFVWPTATTAGPLLVWVVNVEWSAENESRQTPRCWTIYLYTYLQLFLQPS